MTLKSFSTMIREKRKLSGALPDTLQEQRGGLFYRLTD